MIFFPWPTIPIFFPQNDSEWTSVATNVRSDCISDLWTDYREIKLAAVCFGRPILVVDLKEHRGSAETQPGTVCYSLTLYTPFFDAYEKTVEKCTLPRLSQSILQLQQENYRTLVVLYNGEDHYNAMVRTAEVDQGSPDVDQGSADMDQGTAAKQNASRKRALARALDQGAAAEQKAFKRRALFPDDSATPSSLRSFSPVPLSDHLKAWLQLQ